MKETMTIHKALSELKTIDKRFSKELNDFNPFTTNKHSNAKIAGVPVAEYMNSTRDVYKSICTLNNRYNAIKRGITKSNATTVVKIGDKEYTVAEAIDMKNVGVKRLQDILNKMEVQYERCRRDAERKNGDELDRRADDYVKSLYENADMKNMSDELKKVRDTFVESQTTDILDPIGAQKTMKELKDTIDSFMSEVDSALSVSNALTTIEVEYDTL